MKWPFELPPIPQLRVYRVLLPEDGFRDFVGVVRAKEASEGWQADRDACIAAALRWAAEQCELDAWEPCDCGCPGKKRPQSPQAVGQIRAAHRILAALPKEG